MLSGNDSNGRHTVVLADDHTIVRDAVKTIIQSDNRFAIVAESDNSTSTLSLLESLRPDLLVLDLALPDNSGYEILRRMRELALPTRAVVFSMFEEDQKVQNALAAGAHGYVVKSGAPSEILTALATAVSNEIFLPERFKHLINGHAQSTPATERCTTGEPLYKLSKREREVFFLLVDGQPNRIIAKKLFVSPRTVETHRARLIKKLGLNSTADLIRYALRNDLVKL